MSADAQPPARDSRPEHETGAVTDEHIQAVHAALLREKAEPKEGMAPLPLTLLFFFSFAIFAGSVYMAQYSGGYDPMVYNERLRPGVEVAPPAPIDPIEQGRRLYVANCLMCHQEDGSGVAGVFPPLADTEWVLGSEDRLIRILMHGLSGPITVRGNEYNSVMPAFGPTGVNWRDDRIATVLTYIRQAWGNEASEITEEMVAEVRAETSGRTSMWTADELSAIGE